LAKYRVLLVCAAGMSSSLLEVAVIEAARRQGDEVEIEAISVPQVAVFDFAAHRPDIVLIGPQVRYKERSVRQLAEPLGVVVEVIDPVTYGTVSYTHLTLPTKA